MIEHRDALLRLLRDDDTATLALVKAQLARVGAAGLPALRDLLVEADEVSWHHVREVIATVEANEADAVFANLCGRFREQDDIEDAAWRLAATFSPGSLFNAERSVLNAWGNTVRQRLHKARTETDRIETLVEFLGDEIGLSGNTEDYYNVENSILPEVINSRTGIPISLSLVYILVGERAGIPVKGVNLPGHFLVRYGEHFFDPYHGGRRVGLEGCRALLQQQNLVLAPEHLQPTTSRQILIRTLGNILNVAEENDPPLAAKVQGWLESLHNRRA